MADKNSSLEKALAVLDLFQTQSRITMTEAAQATGFSNSSVMRILNSLENMNYIFHDRIDGGYYLADKVYVLGRRTHIKRQLINVIEDPVSQLSRRTGLSVTVSIRSGNRSVTVFRIDSQSGLSLVANVGDNLSLNCTATGKVLAAFSEDYDEIADKIEYVRLTNSTITDRERFAKLLREVRDQKIAYDNEEITEGLVCVAVPILDKDGYAICGISLSGYKDAILRNLDAFTTVLRETARRCERLLQ